MSKEKLVFCALALSQIIIVLGIFMKMGRSTQMFPSIPVKFSHVEVSETNASYSTGNLIYCPKPSTSKTELPITALASFPGCGNTWVRHLIQAMTGILTGSIYNDTRLRLTDFPGEGITDGRVIAIKTHAYHWIPRYQKTVLIIRNPYNALLAEFNRRNSVSRSHTKAATLDKYIKNWNSHVDMVVLQYRGFYLNWIKTKNLHLVVFDNLVDDLESELSSLLQYLRTWTGVVGNVHCALSNSTGSHKRAKTNPVQFFYSSKQIVEINKAIDEIYISYKKRFRKQADIIKQWKF